MKWVLLFLGLFPAFLAGNDLDVSSLVAYSSVSSDSSGVALVNMVSSVWEKVVLSHQDGLNDPKMRPGSELSTHLSSEEALYHYSAAQRGIVDSARLLLTFGVAPSISDVKSSKVFNAIWSNNVSLAKTLLQDEALLGDDFPLHILAAIKNRSEIAQMYIASAVFDVERTPAHGATALMVAACVNNLEMIDLLVQLGDANVNTQHSFAHSTALHFAAEMGQVDAVLRLLALGADIELATKLGGTPLHTASDSNRPLVVQALLSKGANPNALLNGDTTPLYLASQRGFSEVVQVLLDNAQTWINFEMPNKIRSIPLPLVSLQDSAAHDFYASSHRNQERGNGATALHVASENGHLNCVDVLLRHGAVQIPSMDGSSPLLISIQYHHVDIAFRLLEQGSNASLLFIPARDGTLPIHAAARLGNLTLVNKLLDMNHTLLNQVNVKTNTTALSFAVYHHHLAMIDLLLSKGAVVDDFSLKTALAVQSKAQLTLLAKYAGSVEDILDYMANEPRISFAFQIFPALKQLGCLPTRALHLASQSGNIRVLQSIQKVWGKALDVNSYALFTTYWVTPLYLASANNHKDVVKVLLDSKASVTRGIKEPKISPLFVASERGHIQVVELLLPLLLPDEVDERAVEVAAREGHERIVKLFLSKSKKSVAIPALRGALHAAVLNVLLLDSIIARMDPNELAKELVKFLLSLAENSTVDLLRAKVVVQRLAFPGWPLLPQEFSALHAAVIAYSDDETNGEHNACELLHILLQDSRVSSVLEQKTKKTGFSALSLAIEAQRLEVLTLLVNHGASLAGINSKGESPLMQADRVGNANIVHFLLRQQENTQNEL